MTAPSHGLDPVTEWVTIPEAIRFSHLSDKTIRRRIASGQIEARMEGNKYLVRSASLLPAPSESRELVPMAVLEAIQSLQRELQAEAVARAQAEALAKHQSQRVADEAERRAEEVERRQKAEAEVARLTDEIQQLRTVPRRWWQRKT